jgi:hypothetical protein
VDGVKIPFTLVISTPAQSQTIRIQKVEHNKPLEDSTFGRVAK